MDISLGILLAIAGAALIGSFIQRVTGFGFGVFVMTILPFLMPTYGEATALSGLMAMVNALWTTIRMWKHIDWKKSVALLLTFAVVSFFCIGALGHIDGHSARKVLGVVLVLLSIYFFFLGGRVHIKPTVGSQLTTGVISAAMGGFCAIQGPAAVVYFVSCAKDKDEYMGLISSYLLVTNIFMTCFRAGNGFVTLNVGAAWLCALPMIIVGNLLGTKLYNRLPGAVLRKVIYAYMAVAGVLAVL